MVTQLPWETLFYPEIGASRRAVEAFRRARQPKTQIASWQPALELHHTSDALILRAELPGVTSEDLDIQASRDRVLISGRRCAPEQAPGTSITSELRYGAFQRIVALPVAIEPDHIEADLSNGILTLTLPKYAAQRPSMVKVQITESATRDDGVVEPDSGDRPPGAIPVVLPASEVPTSADSLEDPWAVST